MGTDRWAVGRTVRDRVGGNVWVIAQSGAAAGLSWLLAQALVHQPQATFAPFAAIVVLLGGTGGRDPRALRIVLGVLVGLGELLVGVTDRGPPSLAVAAVLAMTLVSTISPGTLPVIHAGIAAMIVVAGDSPASGVGRLVAAVLGAAVALIFSQVLFTPDPCLLLRRALDRLSAAGGDGTSLTDHSRAVVGVDDPRRAAVSMCRFTVRGRVAARKVRELDAVAEELVAANQPAR
jgi:hypothetical protein